MHNGFLQVQGEKMAKSAGNFITIRELLADWPGEVLRLNMLRSHYHQPIDWTLRGLEESEKVLDEWHAVTADVSGGSVAGVILEALTDDLNTPKALTELHALRTRAQTGEALAAEELAGSLRLMGFLQSSAQEWQAQKQAVSGVDAAKVEALIAARRAARDAKDFGEADRIRQELTSMGVTLKDSKAGTTWELSR
jgi:cysteinyl-tRNA synthetase